MKKRERIQGSEALSSKEASCADFREYISTPGKPEDTQYREVLEEFANDAERQEALRVIRGLEKLWGRVSLPSDFREIISDS